jgi:hypothetical protein
MLPAPKIPRLQDLALPLRDIMRGAMALEADTRSRLEPAKRHIPAGLRRLLSSVADAGEGIHAANLAENAPSRADVARAARDIAAWDSDCDPANFGHVAAHALTRALGDARLLVSETVAALVFSQVAARASAGDADVAAAELLLALESHHVAGLAPGVEGAVRDEERMQVHVAVTGLILWLMVERPVAPDTEERLLDLSLAVARAIEPDTSAASGDSAHRNAVADAAALAPVLRRHAGVI